MKYKNRVSHRQVPGFSFRRSLSGPLRESLVRDFGVKLDDEGVSIDRTELSAVATFEGEGIGRYFLVADDDEIGDFLEFCVSDAFAKGFARSIDGDAYRGLPECRFQNFRIGLMPFADRKDADLLGREPEREVAGDIFDKHTEEAFDGTHDGGMDHDDAFVFSLFIDAGKIETFRHAHVELDGRDLPFASEGILGHEIEFRSIESRFPDTVEGIGVFFFRDILENGFGTPPLFLRTEIGVWRRRVVFRDTDTQIETEGSVKGLDDIPDLHEFLFRL